MPKPRRGETEDKFVDRCIPFVIREDGSTSEQAAGKCHGMWREAQTNREFETPEIFSVQVNNYSIRSEMHQGKKHIVVPVVMMVEGVHNGSHGPLLHPTGELGRYPDSWNGIPVVVSHPSENGENVSANRPDIIDQQTVGRVYHAAMDGTRLRGEAWIDEEKIRQISALALGYIMQSRPLEVSLGMFTDDEPEQGIWNGEEYVAIARNHRPDHLALLPGGTGACSWADGCGIRINEEKGGDVVETNRELVINALRYSGTESTAWSAPALADFGVEGRWEDLNQLDKAKVASHYLIGSASAESFADLKLPVVNPKTGKLNERALRVVIGGRGAAVEGISAEQVAAARRRAYRLLNSEFDAGLTIPETLEAKLLGMDGYVQLQINAQGYREIMQGIQSKLDRMDDDTKIHFLQEVFVDTFVYEVKGRDGGPAPALYQRGYSVKADGTIEFTGEPMPVVRKVEYIQTNKERSTKTMEEKKAPKEKINLLIQNCKKGIFTEVDRPALSILEEGVVDKMIAMQKAVAESGGEAQRPPTREEALQVLKETLADPKQFMSLLPDDVRGQIEHGMKLHDAHRKETIARILTNQADKVYTEEELAKMGTDALDKIAQAIKPLADYSALGGGGGSDKEREILPPPGVKIEEKGA